ncbi:hypothetical protein B0H16DRAFT_1450042 [Mycena metata]|uniref:Uncharacterized protein n=1 Tax=Mycena metata TaxID=1033252 RepID=A0AAD7K031_9AGAR|nr:hypothetical protein B0H16DRAFT_1450042 [Mycena metata]
MDIHRSKAECMLHLGEISEQRGDFPGALQLWEQAKPLFERSSQRRQLALVDEKISGIQPYLEADQQRLVILFELHPLSRLAPNPNDRDVGVAVGNDPSLHDYPNMKFMKSRTKNTKSVSAPNTSCRLVQRSTSFLSSRFSRRLVRRSTSFLCKSTIHHPSTRGSWHAGDSAAERWTSSWIHGSAAKYFSASVSVSGTSSRNQDQDLMAFGYTFSAIWLMYNIRSYSCGIIKRATANGDSAHLESVQCCRGERTRSMRMVCARPVHEDPHAEKPGSIPGGVVADRVMKLFVGHLHKAFAVKASESSTYFACILDSELLGDLTKRRWYPPENAETPARWVPPPTDPLTDFLEKLRNSMRAVET